MHFFVDPGRRGARSRKATRGKEGKEVCAHQLALIGTNWRKLILTGAPPTLAARKLVTRFPVECRCVASSCRPPLFNPGGRRWRDWRPCGACLTHDCNPRCRDSRLTHDFVAHDAPCSLSPTLRHVFYKGALRTPLADCAVNARCGDAPTCFPLKVLPNKPAPC